MATLSVAAATSWRAAAPPRSGGGDTASRAQLLPPRTTPATSQAAPRVILGMAPSLAATASSMDRDLPRRQRFPGQIVVAISGRHISGYAVEHPQDRELQRGDP